MSLRDQSFLFLQGLATPFFRELAEDMRRRGTNVDRVNFRAGDRLWWSGPAVDYCEAPENLPGFYGRLFRERGYTDVVLFGDMRPVHRPLHAVAASHGARVHVFEEGYIRPDWVTVEREGVNLNSPLPRNPSWYRRAAEKLPPESPVKSVYVPTALRAAQDVAYRLASTADPLFFPHYRTHRPRRAIAEYTGWAARYARFPFWVRRDRERFEKAVSASAAMFLLPLQLNGDSQIIHHSNFGSVADVIRHVVNSFATHAPSSAQLLIKNHPLDPGLDGHEQVVESASRQAGVAHRVQFLETTNLAHVFPHLSGVVLVNSTTGLSAIWRGIPVHALSDPIYHMPGLTHQGSLHDFWENPTPPDESLYNAFRRVLLHVNHINGDYFTSKGIRLAVEGSRRFFDQLSPLDELLQRVPLAGIQEGAQRAALGGLIRC